MAVNTEPSKQVCSRGYTQVYGVGLYLTPVFKTGVNGEGYPVRIYSLKFCQKKNCVYPSISLSINQDEKASVNVTLSLQIPLISLIKWILFYKTLQCHENTNQRPEKDEVVHREAIRYEIRLPSLK